MGNVIYVIVDKDGNCPTKATGWKDARKLLVYTTIARARNAMKTRGLSEDTHEIIEYVPRQFEEWTNTEDEINELLGIKKRTR